MQVKRLEDLLGRQLFVRDGRRVHLTADGEMLLGYARRLLSLNEEAVASFVQPAQTGTVRFGAPDDFGTRFVPGILSRFASTHPLVDVDVVLAPSLTLLERLEAGELDLTLAICGGDDYGRSGELIHVEPLAWAGLRGGVAHHAPVLPLALSSPRCSWRGMALAALDRIDRRYRVAYCSEHCQGQLAAVLADLAIAPLPISMIGGRLRCLGVAEGLPPIGNFHVFAHLRQPAGPVTETLARHVTESFVELPALAPDERAAPA